MSRDSPYLRNNDDLLKLSVLWKFGTRLRVKVLLLGSQISIKPTAETFLPCGSEGAALLFGLARARHQRPGFDCDSPA